MTKNTILLGALLIILGVGTFALVGFAADKMTALLPAAFGLVFVGIGTVATYQQVWRRVLVPTALALAGLLLLGTLPGLLASLTVVTGGEVARPAAAFEQGFVATLCLGYLSRAFTAFFQTRRAEVQQSA